MDRYDKIRELIEKNNNYTFDDLVSIMNILRNPDGCPWDAEQTHESIRENLIEETYEVIEAIDNNDQVLLCEELGDVMLQIVFHAQMEAEKSTFSINDVINGICSKLIHRHPHVFGSLEISGSDEVLLNWDKIKSEEKKRDTVSSKLRSVPNQLPALMRAEKIGKKADCFDFNDENEIFQKIDEETQELKNALKEGNNEHIEEEAGDLLLTLTSLCRQIGVKPEKALNRATDKFIDRFEAIENELILKGTDIKSLSNDELNEIWNKNKKKHQNL